MSLQAAATLSEAARELLRFSAFGIAWNSLKASSDCVCQCPEFDLTPLAQSLERCTLGLAPVSWAAYALAYAGFSLGVAVGATCLCAATACAPCDRCRQPQAAPRALGNLRLLADSARI